MSRAIWWQDPWWEDQAHLAEYGFSLADVQARIAATVRLFDAHWTRQALDAGGQNIVLSILFGGQGHMPFENLMWLGRIASALVHVATAHRPLRKLIGPENRSAFFELEVASWFAEIGWTVEFPKTNPGTKSPDILIAKNDLRTAIECKRFESEQWEEWTTAFSSTVLRRLVERGVPHTCSFDIELESRLSDIGWPDEPARHGIIDELAESVVTAVSTALATSPPASVRVPGIATIVLRPDRNGSQRGIGGIQISVHAKMRRIVRNGVLEAAQQLRDYSPGAVIVHSDFTPPKELVDAVLRGLNRADAALLGSVGVVAIVGSVIDPPVIWRNPLFKGEALTDRLEADLESAPMRPPVARDF